MPSLYNCRHSGDEYRISKFDPNFNVESTYLCSLTECECPAGHRHTCRHREMLPRFIQREAIGTEWFYDYDRGGWVQGLAVAMERTGETPETAPFNAEGGITPAPAESEGDADLAELALELNGIDADAERIIPALPHGVTMFTLGDPATLHNAIADAVGEPRSPAQPTASPLRRRMV